MTTIPEHLKGHRRGRLPEGPYDLAVVGGGINGVAVARDAVLRGYTACLLEREDIGYGTSSRSSKMLHGGMRYLETLQFRQVFEALRERKIQLELAPHLTSAQTFVIPVYENSKRGKWMIRAGVFLYDLLALGRRLGRGRYLPAEEVLDRVPGLRRETLDGGGLYFDGVMDDARLCLANILDARAAAFGRLQARSYTDVRSIRESAPIEIDVHDRILGRHYRVLAHRVVRAVGPWSDEGRRRPPLLVRTKGVHIVLPPLEASTLGPHGLLLSHSRDGRVFFVIPWMGKTLVGTTETPFDGPLDRLRVEPEEVEYLLSELRGRFPAHSFPRKEILGTFVGVRPLARSRLPFVSPGSVSRKHRILDSGNGVFTVIGGKYTTYRAIAAELVGRALPGRRCETRRRPLRGGEQGDWKRYRAESGTRWIESFDEKVVQRLFHRYGCHLGDVLELASANPELAQPLGPSHPELRAEVVYGVLAEEVFYPEDFISRRTDLRFQKGNGRDVYEAIEELIREHAAPLDRVPPDLDDARKRYFEELEWEDGLRAGE